MGKKTDYSIRRAKRRMILGGPGTGGSLPPPEKNQKIPACYFRPQEIFVNLAASSLTKKGRERIFSLPFQ
jgi:hypothetical protein